MFNLRFDRPDLLIENTSAYYHGDPGIDVHPSLPANAQLRDRKMDYRTLR
jgi:hypothetical protein